MNNIIIRKFYSLFRSHKVHLLAFYASLQIEMTDFPTLSYTSTSEIPTISYT